MSQPWKTDQWFTSPWNWEAEVRDQLQFPETIRIHDVTLRDGEQQTGIVLRREDKVAIAKKLDEAGVHRIEAGMPAVSDEDRALEDPSGFGDGGTVPEVVEQEVEKREDRQCQSVEDAWGGTLDPVAPLTEPGVFSLIDASGREQARVVANLLSLDESQITPRHTLESTSVGEGEIVEGLPERSPEERFPRTAVVLVALILLAIEWLLAPLGRTWRRVSASRRRRQREQEQKNTTPRRART